MAILPWFGGSSDDDSTDSTTDSTTDDTTDTTAEAGPGSVDLDPTPNSPGIPDWVPDWVLTPSIFASKVRGVIYGDLLSGIAALLKPIFAAITLLFLGTNPQVFAAEGEQLGLADVPVWFFGVLGDAVSIPISSYFGALQSFIIEAAPETSGPIEGLVVIIVIVFIVYILAATAVRVFWAIIGLIPGLSGLIGGG